MALFLASVALVVAVEAEEEALVALFLASVALVVAVLACVVGGCQEFCVFRLTNRI